mgnify:CR=1 FL=1
MYKKDLVITITEPVEREPIIVRHYDSSHILLNYGGIKFCLPKEEIMQALVEFDEFYKDVPKEPLKLVENNTDIPVTFGDEDEQN